MSKSGNNIYKRKDGRWEGRYVKAAVDGKTRYGYVYGNTQSEVEGKLELVIQSTFRHIAAEWLRAQKPQLKESSMAKYTNILDTYLLPQYGSANIQSIQRNDFAAFSRSLLESGGAKAGGLSPKTVNCIISVMKNIMEYAGAERNIEVADMRRLEVKQPQKPMRILSLPEQARLNQSLLAHMSPCNLGILLCLYTGMRLGEICALRWEDIHFDEQYLHVHQTMQRIQTLDGGKKKTSIRIAPPKSDCSIRKIPIPNEIFSILIQRKGTGKAYLLTGKDNYFIEPRCLENHFKSAARACEIHDVKFHALRHTFATRCIELGFDVKSLSEILGHASVNITLNRYVHPSMELKQKNMNMLSGLIHAK